MSIYLWLLILFGVSWAMSYMRVSFTLWMLSMMTALLVMTVNDFSTLGAQLVLWLLWSATALLLGVPTIRQRVISNPVFTLFSKMVPVMSNTERVALEAGTVWWDGALFSGRPDWKKFRAFPSPHLSQAEQAYIDGPVKELCNMIDDWEITHHQHDLPVEVWDFLKQQGFFGMIVPKAYGGLQFSALAHSTIVMIIASRSITAAVTVMVPNSLGPAQLLLSYGTQQQKDYYLPRLAIGTEIPCFALTGPEAGSDAGSIPDNGIVCRGQFEGKEIIGIRLNWDKRYITLGPVATILGLAFKLYDPEHFLGDVEDIGITLALIPTDTAGISIGRRHMPLNMVFQNGPNTGKDVFIPLDWIIGGEKEVGHGWRMLMESLSAGRSISLPALSTGAAKLACRATGAYARIRKQFKTPIGYFEGVEERLARIAGYTYIMGSVRTLTASAVDAGEHPSVISAIAKYNLTEMMRIVVNDAMDIQGGSGICLGPRNLIGRIYQAIPISITVEGANILTRTMITYGQGAIRCHPYLLKELEAVGKELPEGRLQFDRALFGHIGFFISNLSRSLFLGLTRAWFSPVRARQETRRYYQYVTWMSAIFALMSDMVSLLYGGSLKRKEKISGRLADMLSCLYLASATIKRYEDQGYHRSDIALLHWAIKDRLYQFQLSLLDLLRNLPSRIIATLLRILIFPTGAPFAPPSDQLGHQAARILLEPSATRDRLTAHIYFGKDQTDNMGRLEDALEKVVAAAAIEGAIHQADKKGQLTAQDEDGRIDEAVSKGIISQQQGEIARVARKARLDVCKVDDFSQDML